MSEPTTDRAAIAAEHHRAGRLAEAEAVYREIVGQRPGDPRLWVALGAVARDAGRFDAAIVAYGEALRRAPALLEAEIGLAETYAHMGQALTQEGRVSEAIEALAACAKILEAKPERASASHNLGMSLLREGSLEEAIASFIEAIQFDPGLADAHNSLGVALRRKGLPKDAIRAFRTAFRLESDHADAACNLGCALMESGEVDEAIATLRDAARLRPDFAVAHNNLGNALLKIGERDEAIALFGRALAVRPDYALAHSNLLFALHGHPNYDAEALWREHTEWSRRHAEPLGRSTNPHPNDRTPDRRIRVGYVSADFRRHPVGWFLSPILSAHDHRAFEVFCYADVAAPDDLTLELRSHADTWRDIVGLSDERVATMVRDDAIDILVDLAMHTADNRLLVFARKPAPVQVTYLAYCSTTGLETIDYRITDPYLDPSGSPDRHYSEKSVRLPDTYWCYRPALDSIDVGRVPARSSGQLTFGCLNDFGKVTPEALALWARLLVKLPRSRLLLHAPAGGHRRRAREVLSGADVDPQRLEFVGRLPIAEYLQRYQQIDVCLDPFPYGGGATTCDALWMGVPVVTLSGRTAVGRGGASILSNVGLRELVAKSKDEYLAIAEDLATDPARLEALRRGLRQTMKASPLMDGPRFTRNLEAAYRQMWLGYCQGSGGPHPFDVISSA